MTLIEKLLAMPTWQEPEAGGTPPEPQGDAGGAPPPGDPADAPPARADDGNDDGHAGEGEVRHESISDLGRGATVGSDVFSGG